MRQVQNTSEVLLTEKSFRFSAGNVFPFAVHSTPYTTNEIIPDLPVRWRKVESRKEVATRARAHTCMRENNHDRYLSFSLSLDGARRETRESARARKEDVEGKKRRRRGKFDNTES